MDTRFRHNDEYAHWMDTPARRALDAMRRDAEHAERLQALLERRAQTPTPHCSASPERRAERRKQKAQAQHKKAVRKQGRR